MGKYKIIFIDIGGVLLTNGWDRQSRTLAAETFGLDFKEMQSRHELTFDTYEIGKISLEEYLQRIVFYEKRDFTPLQFQQFIFSQSQPFPEMIQLIGDLKKRYNIKIAALNNEGRELNAYRIHTFGLSSFIDFYISSGLVQFRKPDFAIYRLALDIAQIPAEESIYIDDRLLFVQVAESMGLCGLHHIDFATTKAQLAKLNLDLQQELPYL